MWVRAVSIRGKYCPCAIDDYKKYSLTLGPNHKDLHVLATLVRKHLIFLGWKVDRWIGGSRIRYTSPSGSFYFSLRDICCNVLNLPDDNRVTYDTSPSSSVTTASSGGAIEDNPNEEVDKKFQVLEESSDEIVRTYARIGIHAKSRSMLSPAKDCLAAMGWRFDDRLRKSKTRKEKVYISPTGRKFYSMRQACDWWSKNNAVLGNKLDKEERPRKRKRDDIISADFQDNQNCTMLSRMIDSIPNLNGAKVEYRCKKNGPSLKEGHLYREGIKCHCCQLVFNLSKFEAHAGSHRHRPSESLFLEDGRSLMECRHVISNKKIKTNDEHDFVCSICRRNGQLLSCNACPSAFHANCLGLIYKEVSHNDWYCPACCCGACGGRNEDDREQFRFSANCTQCRFKYHVGCLKENINSDEGNWFCSERCQSIYYGLQEVVEKPVQLGSDHNLLSWICFGQKKDDAEKETLSKIRKKLNLALQVMHESFDPIREEGNDIVKSILFNKWSNLNRLNFENFYTLLLERDNQVTTVATVRIHGGKVAEIPLIATKHEYRGQGFCRMLMCAFEKKLIELGVERLILPASDHALNTWINSFGFSIMEDSKKLELAKYVFLNFPDTILCYKFLGSPPVSEP